MVIKKKTLEYYLNLPWSYTIEIDRDETGQKIYVITVNELPGVSTDAQTIEEGMVLINEAMIGVLKLYLKHGDEIPEPVDESVYKGNIAYRTTSKRHYLLAKEAQKTNTSLSKVIDTLIDQTLTRK